jgi:hypothetical protein
VPVAPAITLLPFIIRLFPVLGRMPIPLGRVIPLFEQTPSSDEALARALAVRVRVRRPRRKTKATNEVLTLDDAISSVEKVLSDGKIQKLGVLAAAAKLQNITGTGQNDVAQAIADELAEHTLSQKGARRNVKIDETIQKRPCRGHGHGNVANLRRGNT